MRMIRHVFPWTPRPVWAWPDDDVKLLQVIDDVQAVDEILRYVPEDRREGCIQAGGACGVWPHRLARDFIRVWTFEPLASNLECMAVNLDEVENVEVFYGALGSVDPLEMINAGGAFMVEMAQHPNETRNAGSYQVDRMVPLNDAAPEGPVPIAYALDMFEDEELDISLIVLDVEGSELLALRGAERMIRRHRPTIVVEDKGLSTKYGIRQGEVVKWLEARGYQEVARIKRDVVLCPSRVQG